MSGNAESLKKKLKTDETSVGCNRQSKVLNEQKTKQLVEYVKI